MNARRAVRLLLVVATLGLVLVPAVNRFARRLLRGQKLLLSLAPGNLHLAMSCVLLSYTGSLFLLLVIDLQAFCSRRRSLSSREGLPRLCL